MKTVCGKKICCDLYSVIDEIIIDSRMMANADETAKESKHLGCASCSVNLSF